MNPQNVSLADFMRFLVANGCKCIRHHKGHYIYSHPKATRPITFQDHIDPVPLMVIKTNIKTLGLTLKAIRDFA